MTIEDLKRHLERHGVPEDLYVIQELGIGEVRGIGFLDGRWCTYYYERGSYRQVQPYDTEEAAVEAFLDQAGPCDDPLARGVAQRRASQRELGA